MFRPLAIALIAMCCLCAVPGVVRAQDTPALTLQFQAPDVRALDVRMTVPAGAEWQPHVRARPAVRGPMLPGLYVSLAGLQAYDGYSTNRGLKNGAIESNRFMGSLVRHPAALWAAKGGAAFVSIYMAERLWRQHRRGQAIAVMLASNGLMAVVAANNRTIIRARQ